MTKKTTNGDQSGVVKLTETKFPFGLRMGKIQDLFILDFVNQRDEKTSEIFSSIALNKDLAADIHKALGDFIKSPEVVSEK